MKRGFTLVELLATIVVISIVALIIFPLVSKNIGGAREDLYEVQVQNIIKAAKAKALEEESILKNAKYGAVYISVEELQTSTGSNGKTYLESETIKNPIEEDKVMNGYVEILYNEEEKGYTYKYLTEEEYKDLNISTSKQAGEYILSKQDKIYTNELVSGLFEDTETNMYYFKGARPNNYISIAGKTWTIISINKETKEVKLAKIRADGDTDKSVSIWNLGTGKPKYNLTVTDLDMYKYLGTSYTNLPENLKKYVKKATWNVGEVAASTKSLSQARKEEADATIESYVGLLTVSDYAYATNVLSCRTNYIDNNTCATNNYLAVNEGYFLMNPVKDVEQIWTASSDGLSQSDVTSEKLVYQTIILSSSAKISGGTGTSTDNYILELN